MKQLSGGPAAHSSLRAGNPECPFSVFDKKKTKKKKQLSFTFVLLHTFLSLGKIRLPSLTRKAKQLGQGLAWSLANYELRCELHCGLAVGEV